MRSFEIGNCRKAILRQMDEGCEIMYNKNQNREESDLWEDI